MSGLLKRLPNATVSLYRHGHGFTGWMYPQKTCHISDAQQSLKTTHWNEHKSGSQWSDVYAPRAPPNPDIIINIENTKIHFEKLRHELVYGRMKETFESKGIKEFSEIRLFPKFQLAHRKLDPTTIQEDTIRQIHLVMWQVLLQYKFYTIGLENTEKINDRYLSFETELSDINDVYLANLIDATRQMAKNNGVILPEDDIQNRIVALTYREQSTPRKADYLLYVTLNSFLKDYVMYANTFYKPPSYDQGPCCQTQPPGHGTCYQSLSRGHGHGICYQPQPPSHGICYQCPSRGNGTSCCARAHREGSRE